MAFHAIRGKAIIAILTTAAALTAGGVALASTPETTSAVAAPHTYVAQHNANIRLPFSHLDTIGHADLPSGAYTVTAKAWMVSVAGLGNSEVLCKLTLGGSSDQVQADAQDSTVSQPVRNEAIYLTLSGSISKSGQAKLSCGNFGGGNTDLKFIKITAIKVIGVTKMTF